MLNNNEAIVYIQCCYYYMTIIVIFSFSQLQDKYFLLILSKTLSFSRKMNFSLDYLVSAFSLIFVSLNVSFSIVDCSICIFQLSLPNRMPYLFFYLEDGTYLFLLIYLHSSCLRDSSLLFASFFTFPSLISKCYHCYYYLIVSDSFS